MPLTMSEVGELPEAVVATITERDNLLGELGIAALSAYKSSDGRVHVTFRYATGQARDADAFNRRERERAELFGVLSPHLEAILPADGRPMVIHECRPPVSST